MLFNIKFHKGEPIYIQIYKYIKDMIDNGMLPYLSKLPSTREMASIMNISRSTVMNVYEKLEEEGLVNTLKGRGTFVAKINVNNNKDWSINWENNLNSYAVKAENMDIMKHEKLYKKGMISFKSIAPDESYFDIEEVKRAFANLISMEGNRILNYGYARGYKPLIDFLKEYMSDKGVNLKNKDIIITNGFTEGFNMILSSITKRGDNILCENPTHNTAIKIMKLHGLKLVGVPMNKDGMNINALEKILQERKVKFSYLIPSYHNPTGIVMSYKSREQVYNLLKKHNVPIIEDGFNEELQHLGAHIAPMATIAGEENSVIYIGSFSKILFPGIRIGWICADSNLIDAMESVKRSKNIHTSALDQGILYEYMRSGEFSRYLKRVRNIYREKFDLARNLAEKYIPNEYIYGDGGLYIFIKLKGINSRKLLEKCCKRGVIFTPGDIFYTDGGGKDTFRLAFSRTSLKDIEKGIKIIGEEAQREYTVT
ncbi:PLP-dependent aminotransferase family protein [Haloimpatiens massiliensis]|uniref:MocR-like pyridoxine biosynthesis transcription factor PdxR n=1 Tax=Haloimpatiens massiliensis TaxID=1658110 RepID=UPI000C85685D|nr:PLP-dependent aminotransferase family protein [Haloimpatiens massiliensis]